MPKQQSSNNFIGRERELHIYEQWLTEANTPLMLYFYDAFAEKEKKGGIGKTWLLKKCASLTREKYPDTTIVSIDFFNVTDRNGTEIAERVVAQLQHSYPDWYPQAFTDVLVEYQTAMREEDPYMAQARSRLSDALTTDLNKLEAHLHKTHRHLLLFFDTFELIEENPVIAVLNPTQTFPDTYHFPHIGVVMAGRNALDWTHSNWQKREQEVLSVGLTPFNLTEMLQYIDIQSSFTLTAQSSQAQTLYSRTEGRPILIGLVTDVINHRIQNLEGLLAVPLPDFEGYLVTRINDLENPLNWVLLFMAHAYHRFNISLLEWLLQQSHLRELVPTVKHQQLLQSLPNLSFVRQSTTGQDFVLHDEMRRLITKYCWEVQDPTGEIRQDISRSTILYYEHELQQGQNSLTQQTYTVERLYHMLYLDLTHGLDFFQQHFARAIMLWLNSYARSLLQEAQKFIALMSNTQRYQLVVAEARLLLREEKPAAALELFQLLTKEADKAWFSAHRAEIAYGQGDCYLDLNDFPQAIAYFTESLEIEKEHNNEEQYADILYLLGFIYRRQGQYDQAIRYYEESSEIYKKVGNKRGYANMLNSIGNSYRLQGKTEEALRQCKIALRIRENLFKSGNASEIAVGLSHNTIGLIYLDIDDLVKAEESFRFAMELFRNTGYKKGIAVLYNRLGQVEIARKNLDLAMQYFAQGYEESFSVDFEAQINSLNKQGRILLQKKKLAEAKNLFMQAITLAQKAHDHYQEAESQIDLARLLEEEEQYALSQQRLNTAKTIAEEYNYYSLSGLVEQALGDADYKKGHYQAAFAHYGAFCHYMALYNTIQYNNAVRSIIDILLEIPVDEIPTIIDELRAYWNTHKLDEAYPEFIDACEEVDKLIV